jgi:hypothetical protein
VPHLEELDEVTRDCAARCLDAPDPRQCVSTCAGHLALTTKGWTRPDVEAMADEAVRIIAFVRAGGKRKTDDTA